MTDHDESADGRTIDETADEIADEIVDGEIEDDESAHDGDRTAVRREVMWLTLLGLVLTAVAGVGTWRSKWDTSEFWAVELIGDRIVSIGYPCNGDARLEVEEFDDRVEIGQTVRATTSDDCESVRCITLAAPLGDRRVINTGTDDEVSVRPSQAVDRCVATIDP